MIKIKYQPGSSLPYEQYQNIEQFRVKEVSCPISQLMLREPSNSYLRLVFKNHTIKSVLLIVIKFNHQNMAKNTLTFILINLLQTA